MTKKDFVDALAKKLGTKYKDGEAIYETFLDLLQDTIVKEKKFTFSGFGTFHLKERGARTGRNPRTGEAVKVKASKTITFKASHVLKSDLKGGK